MPTCIVPWCKNCDQADDRKSTFQKEIEKHMKITLHKLPKNEERRKEWLESLQLSEPTTKTAFVCSLHFMEKDINRTLNQTCLREDAVPTYFPFDDYDNYAEDDDDDDDDDDEEDDDVDNNDNDNEDTGNIKSSEENMEWNSQESYLDASFSPINHKFMSEQASKHLQNYCTIYNENQSEDNRFEIILDESTGQFLKEKNACTGRSNCNVYRRPKEEKKNFDPCNENYFEDVEEFLPSDNCMATLVKTTRSTCTSPLFLDDDEERIRQLESIIIEKAQKEAIQQHTLKYLEKKIARREELIEDLKSVISTLKKTDGLTKFRYLS